MKHPIVFGRVVAQTAGAGILVATCGSLACSSGSNATSGETTAGQGGASTGGRSGSGYGGGTASSGGASGATGGSGTNSTGGSTARGTGGAVSNSSGGTVSSGGSPGGTGGHSGGASGATGGNGANSTGGSTARGTGGAVSNSSGGTVSSGGNPGGTGGHSGGASGATGGISATGGASTNSTSVVPTCQANCTGKTCGDDGCNGTCGGCPPSQLCGSSGTCVASSSTTSIVVDAHSQGTPISSAIYGVAFNSDDSMQLAALNRWGGDAVSSYNWQIDVSNSGSDWNCANYKGRFTSPTPDPSLTTSSDQFVHYNITRQADTLMTIPITGWVASMVTPNPGTPDCAGGTAISTCCQTLGTSEEELVDQGSGVLDASFMGSWVTHLVSTFGSAANGGVKYYQLDNEPDNWQGLRTDIYPALYPPGTWCEPFYTTNTSIGTSLNQDFINRTMAYSKAIKAADPTASVLFMCTENAEDLVAIPNNECGNPTGPYSVNSSLTMAILKLGAAAQAANHVRLLDCVDMHYPFLYPRKGLGDTSAFWDSTSTSVVPHVQGWINSTYPGTGICVSEYNVPNDGSDGNTPDPTTGAQQADLLGMYGRLGYKVASYFVTLVHGSTHLPIYNAMAMYRNYDGNGGRFGSYSVGTASPNAGVNVYASTDSPTNPTKLWVMLVNVSSANQTNLSITVNNFTPSGSAEVYQMVDGAAPAAAPAATITNGIIGGLSLSSGSVALLAMSK